MSDQTHDTEVPETPETGADDPTAALDAAEDAARDMAQEAAEAAAEQDDAAAAEAAGEAEGEPDPGEQIRELNEKLLRAMADVENTRRIAAREKADAGKYAVTNFARDILRVADFLNMATMAVTEDARKADPNLDNLCVGIDMTMKELLNVFEGYGIKPIPTDGQFDHNLHEAISQEENPDVPKGTILSVQRGGFTIQDRLLRPAQVIVATGGPKANGDDSGEGTGEAGGGEGGQKAYEPGPAGTGRSVDQET